MARIKDAVIMPKKPRINFADDALNHCDMETVYHSNREFRHAKSPALHKEEGAFCYSSTTEVIKRIQTRR
jgi:hypothetical protein